MAFPRIILFSGRDSGRVRDEPSYFRELTAMEQIAEVAELAENPDAVTWHAPVGSGDLGAFYPFHHDKVTQITFWDADQGQLHKEEVDSSGQRKGTVRKAAIQVLVDAGIERGAAEKITKGLSNFEDDIFAYELAAATDPLANPADVDACVLAKHEWSRDTADCGPDPPAPAVAASRLAKKRWRLPPEERKKRAGTLR